MCLLMSVKKHKTQVTCGLVLQAAKNPQSFWPSAISSCKVLQVPHLQLCLVATWATWWLGWLRKHTKGTQKWQMDSTPSAGDLLHTFSCLSWRSDIAKARQAARFDQTAIAAASSAYYSY